MFPFLFYESLISFKHGLAYLLKLNRELMNGISILILIYITSKQIIFRPELV